MLSLVKDLAITMNHLVYSISKETPHSNIYFLYFTSVWLCSILLPKIVRGQVTYRMYSKNFLHIQENLLSDYRLRDKKWANDIIRDSATPYFNVWTTMDYFNSIMCVFQSPFTHIVPSDIPKKLNIRFVFKKQV